MNEKDQSLDSLQDVKDIRRLMERSTRFISLSGLSGVAAGVCALAGAAIGRFIVFQHYYSAYNERGYFADPEFRTLKLQLLLLAGGVFVAAFISSFYFTWRTSSSQGVSLLNNPTSRRLFWNMALPLITGGLFILGMLWHNEWRFVAPSCLIFYGLALMNASKYTLPDIRYLGYCEIVTGLVNMLFIGYGLYFWAFGFGFLHIVYGILMWTKYERK
jgi:hypothetical protein